MITKEFHSEIMTDVSKFNQFLSDYTEIILQRVILEIPKMVLHHMQETQKIGKLREEFYKKNPSLIKHDKIVQQTANSLHAKHLDWSIEKVFDETAIKATDIFNKEKSNDQGF